MSNSRKSDVNSRVVAMLAAISATAALGLLVAQAAMGQPYGGSTGDLTATQSPVFSVSGDGFTAGSVVRVVLLDMTGEELDLGTLAADDGGAVAGSVTLPDGLAPGRYTLSATGVTADGTLRSLSADVDLFVDSAADGSGGCGPLSWVLLILAVGSAAAAGWCFFTRRQGAGSDADAG